MEEVVEEYLFGTYVGISGSKDGHTGPKTNGSPNSSKTKRSKKKKAQD